MIAPTYLASTQINTGAVVGWTCLGFGFEIVVFISLGCLHLFEREERKRSQNINQAIVN